MPEFVRKPLPSWFENRVVFQKLFTKQTLKERLRRCCQLNRNPLWIFEGVTLMLRTFLQRAGQLVRPNGTLTLTLSANTAVEARRSGNILPSLTFTQTDHPRRFHLLFAAIYATFGFVENDVANTERAEKGERANSVREMAGLWILSRLIEFVHRYLKTDRFQLQQKGGPLQGPTGRSMNSKVQSTTVLLDHYSNMI